MVIDVKEKLKSWGLLKTRKDYEFYKALSDATFNEKIERYGLSLISEVIELFKLKDESKIKRYIVRISGRENRILLADTYLYMRKEFQEFTTRCESRIISSCAITGQDCDVLSCPLKIIGS